MQNFTLNTTGVHSSIGYLTNRENWISSDFSNEQKVVQNCDFTYTSLSPVRKSQGRKD